MGYFMSFKLLGKYKQSLIMVKSKLINRILIMVKSKKIINSNHIHVR